MAENARADKDWWDRCESSAKILAGVCAAFGALLIPWFINKYTEENRKSQVYVQMMAERERSDTGIREKMFKGLLDGYLQTLKDDVKKEDLESFRKRVVFLELLAVNFQEFINTKPLFEEVYDKLVKHRGLAKGEQKKAWMELEKKIRGVSRDMASRQATTLNSIGDSIVIALRKGEVGCIRLYEKTDIEGLRKRDGATRFEYFEPGDCSEEEAQAGTSTPANKDQSGEKPLARKGYRQRQSIELRVKALEDVKANFEVTVYADFFDRNILVRSELERTFPVNVSYFDLPYLDNIKLADGHRFALVLTDIEQLPGEKEYAKAWIEAIRFRNEFMSLRDRPLFEEMLKKLQ